MKTSFEMKPAEGALDAAQEGELLQISAEGYLLVRDVSAPAEPVECLFVRGAGQVPQLRNGDRVLFMRARDDARRGYVLGRLERYVSPVDLGEGVDDDDRARSEVTEIKNQFLHLKAEKGLVIECGTGSVVITHDGKIEIKGKELLSRARGANKIKGAAVNIN